MYHERNLPLLYPPQAIQFVTWCLYGSRPHCEIAPGQSGRAFAEADRMMDKAAAGARWLTDLRIAEIVSQTLENGERLYRLYERRAWVIMPNHVHLVFQPLRPLPEVMRWIKGSSARQANIVLRRTGRQFWQRESYDHCVRNTDELNRVIRYVERNPVSAGLVSSIEAWPWSSANAGQKAYATPSF